MGILDFLSPQLLWAGEGRKGGEEQQRGQSHSLKYWQRCPTAALENQSGKSGLTNGGLNIWLLKDKFSWHWWIFKWSLTQQQSGNGGKSLIVTQVTASPSCLSPLLNPSQPLWTSSTMNIQDNPMFLLENYSKTYLGVNSKDIGMKS